MSTSTETFVIVGAGLAGATAAESLRERGFDGPLVMVGDESERPYDHPPLSKGYLKGEDDVPYLHEPDFYADHDIELRCSTRVTGLDVGLGELLLEGDRRLGYDRLLIATGALPRRLDVPGSDLDGIHYLRTLRDSQQLREKLAAKPKTVVIGAGWIGAEVAAAARDKGCDVTLLDTMRIPFERILGREVGRVYLDVHREHGVRFVPETHVVRFEGSGSVERVVTGDGAVIEAELAVVGIGVGPRTGLVEGGGLAVDNGLLVNEQLQTSAPGVFAAGDVANAKHPFYGHRIRVEHWATAQNQGRFAAGAMLGAAEAYSEIPYFFSDQYDTGMEYTGHATKWDEVVFRGDTADREFIAFWLRHGRVIAGMNMNVWDVTDSIRELITSKREVDPGALADPDVPLADTYAKGRAAQAQEIGAWASEGGSL